MLSIHTSRNYFITHCIEKLIPPTDIIDWTGQTSFKVFYDYVKKGRNSEDRMKDIFKLPKNRVSKLVDEQYNLTDDRQLLTDLYMYNPYFKNLILKIYKSTKLVFNALNFFVKLFLVPT